MNTLKESIIEILTEGGMPSSIAHHKQAIKHATDAENIERFKGKSKQKLRQMAWSDGHGKMADTYLKFHDGVTQDSPKDNAPLFGRKIQKEDLKDERNYNMNKTQKEIQAETMQRLVNINTGITPVGFRETYVVEGEIPAGHKNIYVSKELEGPGDRGAQDRYDVHEMHKEIHAAAKQHKGKVHYKDPVNSKSDGHVTIHASGNEHFHKEVKDIANRYEASHSIDESNYNINKTHREEIVNVLDEKTAFDKHFEKKGYDPSDNEKKAVRHNFKYGTGRTFVHSKLSKNSSGIKPGKFNSQTGHINVKAGVGKLPEGIAEEPKVDHWQNGYDHARNEVENAGFKDTANMRKKSILADNPHKPGTPEHKNWHEGAKSGHESGIDEMDENTNFNEPDMLDEGHTTEAMKINHGKVSRGDALIKMKNALGKKFNPAKAEVAISHARFKQHNS